VTDEQKRAAWIGLWPEVHGPWLLALEEWLANKSKTRPRDRQTEMATHKMRH